MDWREKPLTPEDVGIAIRLILGREPDGERELHHHMPHATLGRLRDAFLASEEFANNNRGLLRRHYAVPLHLLRPMHIPGVEARFEEPSLAAPVSQLCTAAQLREPAYAAICGRMGVEPNLHRKPWELAWVSAVLERAGKLTPGHRFLGFGCGEEPLPSFFALHGVSVLATDAPYELIANQGWDSTNQFAAGPDSLFRGDLLAREAFDRQVGFRPVDMNAIPPDLQAFDACWSACALEHLGSIEHGLRFIENSMATLRPGGLAVHTTEFNLGSDTDTIDQPGLCLFRRQDIERLLARLVEAGHKPWPVNFHPGAEELDQHIDLPPYNLPHLKLDVAGYVTGSIGIVVERG